jgi:pimeloyl-ACP methyl ester carboxylesterase
MVLDRDKFAASLAGDVPDEESAFMADSQVPWEVAALRGAVSCPAWRAKPSWYLVTNDDRMIPPPAQWAMCERIGATTVEVAASHAVYVSQPEAVAALISAAAEATTSS